MLYVGSYTDQSLFSVNYCLIFYFNFLFNIIVQSYISIFNFNFNFMHDISIFILTFYC